MATTKKKTETASVSKENVENTKIIDKEKELLKEKLALQEKEMADLNGLRERAKEIREEILKNAEQLVDSKAAYEVRKDFLDSKKGKIGALMKEMRDVPKEQKAEYGDLWASHLIKNQKSIKLVHCLLAILFLCL